MVRALRGAQKRGVSTICAIAHTIAGIGVICTIGSGTASAQFSMIEDPAHRFEWQGSLRSEFLNEFKTDTDGGDEFESWRLGILGDWGGPVNESILLGIAGGYRYTSYSFHLDNGPGRPPDYGTNELPRDPWGGLNTFDLVPSATILVGSQVAVRAAVPIRWSGEVGARRNGFNAGISALVTWQPHSTIRLGAGIGVTSQIEDDAETFPIVSLVWTPTQSVSLVTEGSWIQGGNATLLWSPSDKIHFTLSAGYERNRFRLDDHGDRADRNGVGEVTAVPLEVGLRFVFMEGGYFDFRLGLGVAGEFRVETDNGRKLYNEDYDPAPRIGVGLTIPFGLPTR